MDNAKAEALRLAKEYLEMLGGRYEVADIGRTARAILKALEEAS